MVCGFHFGALNLDLIPFHWEIMSEYPIVLSCIIIFVIFGMCPFFEVRTVYKSVRSSQSNITGCKIVPTTLNKAIKMGSWFCGVKITKQIANRRIRNIDGY